MKIKLIVLALIVMLYNCDNNTKRINKEKISVNNCDSVIKGKEYLETNIPIYKIDTSFYHYLDTIINTEKKCPFYNSCKSGFLLTITYDSIYYGILISSTNIYSYDYSNSEGLFEYKNHRFIIDNDLINVDFLKKTNSDTTVKYLNLDRTNWHPINDNRYSTWYFDFKNNEILFTGHHPCSQSRKNKS